MLALCIGMSIQITNKLIQHLSKQIACGKVIWSLLTLNEYCNDSNNPLVKALRSKARQAINNAQDADSSQSLYQLLLDGRKFSEFSAEQQNEIRLIKENSGVKVNKNLYYRKKVVVPGAYINRKIFRAQYSNVHFSLSPSSLWSSRNRSYVRVNSTKREASSAD